jgi:hypothetical protein
VEPKKALKRLEFNPHQISTAYAMNQDFEGVNASHEWGELMGSYPSKYSFQYAR